MTAIARGTLLSFDSATWLAMVFLDGVDQEAQIPVGQWVPSGMLTVGVEVAVLLFSETNTDDAVVLGAYGAVGSLSGVGTPTFTALNLGTQSGAGAGELRASSSVSSQGGMNVGTASAAATGQIRTSHSIIPGDTSASAAIKSYAIGGLANNGIAALLSDNLSAKGLVFVINSNDATSAIYQLRGAIHTTQEIADPINVFTPTAGSAASTNIYWSAGNSRYEIENKTGGARTYEILYFGE